jgi:hypothetical protein
MRSPAATKWRLQCFRLWELSPDTDGRCERTGQWTHITAIVCSFSFGFHALLTDFTVKRVRGSREPATEPYPKPVESSSHPEQSYFSKSRQFLK